MLSLPILQGPYMGSIVGRLTTKGNTTSKQSQSYIQSTGKELLANAINGVRTAPFSSGYSIAKHFTSHRMASYPEEEQLQGQVQLEQRVDKPEEVKRQHSPQGEQVQQIELGQ